MPRRRLGGPRRSRYDRIVAARRSRHAARRSRYLIGAALVILVIALVLALGFLGGGEVPE